MSEYKNLKYSEEPQLKKEPFNPKETLPSGEYLREKLKDPKVLPTREEVQKAFPNWELWHEYYSSDENPIYDVFTEEYIEKLSDYLAEQVENYGATEAKPLVIVELGAGNGKLSHFMEQKIDEKMPGKVKIIAIDSEEDNIKKVFPVEKMDIKEALEKHRPDIAISSWMPYKIDFTNDIRKCKNLKEYILIGESDAGCCGHPFETWGYPHWELIEAGIEIEAPYKKDGFERKNHPDLKKLQMCRIDQPGAYYHSNTVSFIRK
jgi:hypothetical protein